MGSISPIDPNKDGTYRISLGSTLNDTSPRQTFHALKYNFKPAAIDYSQPGNLTVSDGSSDEVSLALPSTTEGEHHIFKGPLQETKSNEFILVYNPDNGTFVLERLSSMTRLSQTRGSRANTLNGNGRVSSPNPSAIDRSVDPSRTRSKSNDDVPTISLDQSTFTPMEQVLSDPDEPIVPTIITPRLPPVSPMQSRHQESSSDSDIDLPKSKPQQTKDEDDEVSDEDLDDLANELESSLENKPGSPSSDSDSDLAGLPKTKPPDFGNVPRSSGPISMSRFAGGRRREEEESSSSDDDDDD